jgi:hypothetical protein
MVLAQVDCTIVTSEAPVSRQNRIQSVHELQCSPDRTASLGMARCASAAFANFRSNPRLVLRRQRKSHVGVPHLAAEFASARGRNDDILSSAHLISGRRSKASKRELVRP